ncbi:PREDICTED: mitochondrial ribonuclease P protein 3 [Vollenhovia emeryi]|uniref:mitochondrial ribonuclease P protein 3 n=1 Tax=Vollenhovia emeryi TaxID=411798 RepID=UPI0005F36A18|nr:PREDICTED: mitochondrial ribonuclease P protein 3 [Vollenhovia emeryi]
MTLLCKLYQPLWFRSNKFHKSVYSLTTLVYTNTTNNLDSIVTKNADTFKEMTGGSLTVKWKDLREKILHQNNEITPATVDSTIIDMCLRYSYLDNAIAYFKFLRENNYPLNMAVIGKYLRLYAWKKPNSLTDADKVDIVETFNDLIQKHPLLDYITAGHCVVSLCLTDEWLKTQEIIEMVKLTSSPNSMMYSALASAAFRNGKPDIAWKALSDLVSYKLTPNNAVYESHLQYCQFDDAKAFNSRMEEMFNLWAEHSIIPCNEIINAYADKARKYDWSTELVTISRETGHCRHCGYSLPKITFTEEEFGNLAKSMMDKVIIGSDVYRKTNPKELLKFQKFIEDTKPYDIVIDGLNITYFQKSRSYHNESEPKLTWLINVVEHFKKQRKRILVLTRKHQKKLSTFKHVERLASVFLIDNLSSDDPYILYATLASGINSKFISLDLMRQHKHSLQNSDLQRAFKKWQYSHQYFVERSKTGIRMLEPFACMPNVQKSGNCWHVPCVSDDIIKTESYKFPDKWYCLKYTKKTNK